jgi:hypothetical protein
MRRRIVARFVFIACTALLGFSGGAYAGGGVYQRTKDGETIVWNNYPRPGDEASWSGGKDGQGYATGDGTLTWHKRGVLVSRYTGRMIRGKLNGPVTNVDANGGTFRGTFVNGSKSADWAQGTDKGQSTKPAPTEERKQPEERAPQAEAQAAEERNQQAQTKAEKERPEREAAEQAEWPPHLDQAQRSVLGTWTYTGSGMEYAGRNYWLKLVFNEDGTVNTYHVPTTDSNWGSPRIATYNAYTEKYIDSGQRYFGIKIEDKSAFCRVIVEVDGSLRYIERLPGGRDGNNISAGMLQIDDESIKAGGRTAPPNERLGWSWYYDVKLESGDRNPFAQ